MKDILILSINILDKAEELIADHQSARSAFRKIPVESETIELGMEGFKGDMVENKNADKIVNLTRAVGTENFLSLLQI